MNETVLPEQKAAHLPIISSGSLAGLMFIINLYTIVNSLIILRLYTAEEGPFAYQEPGATIIAAWIGTAVMIAFYTYMYYAHSRVRIHRVLWLIIAAYIVYGMVKNVLLLQSETFQSSFKLHIGHGYSFIAFSLIAGLVNLVLALWGYKLATAEEKHRPAETEPVENRAHLVLRRYQRPGLTSPGLALVLAIVAINHLAMSFFMAFFAGESYAYEMTYIYSNAYLAGLLLFMGGCVSVYFNRESAGAQRWSWVVCILSSLIFFLPVLGEFRNFSPHDIGEIFYPISILFLSVRGYCLARVDDELRSRDPHEPVEDQYGSPILKFYFIKPPFGITSSRLGGIAVILMIPILFTLAGFMAEGLEEEDLEFLLFAIPFVLVFIGYLRIYHSPSTPWRHKGWWWYSLALSGIMTILGLIELGSERPHIMIPIIFGILIIVSLMGVNRTNFDEPYERRLA